MTLLAPLFLFGLVAIALPLWLHRLRVRNAQQQPFSSALLLEQQNAQLRARRRWRYLALLALRLLLLAALCCAYAQPIWRQHNAPRALRASLQLIVLDTSLSMSADARFERARAAARRIIDELGVGQRAQLLSASDGLAVVSSAGSEPTADTAALRAALAQLQAGAGRLDYGAAMASLDAVLGKQRGLIDVHFISDFQATGTPTRFADLLPPAALQRTLAVQLHPVGPDSAEANWAVTSIARSGADILVSVRGMNTPARMLDVSLEVNGKPVGRVTQQVSAAGEAQFRFKQPILRLGDNRVIARLLNDDALAADNVRWAVIRNAPLEPVALLTGEPDGRAVKYLATALAASGEGYAAEVHTLSSFDARALARYRWVMIDDLGVLDESSAAQLRAFVAGGGAVFAALAQQAASLEQLPLLGDRLQGSVGDGDAALTVGQIDASHPLLAGLRGWESLNISHLLVVAPQSSDRVLVGASNGAPLLLERRIGRGRVILYTSDLNDDWNDLPVQPLFVGLMAQVGDYLGGRGELPAAQTVGATLALGRNGGPSGQLIDPSGRSVLSLADTSRARTVKFDQSGFYQIYTPSGETLVAVNPDPLESDLTPMSAGQMVRWRSALSAARTVPTDDESIAARSNATGGAVVALAPILLGLLVVLVLAESLLGNHTLQRRVGAEAVERG